MTGHGGEDFLKFQDAQEISNVELADAFEQMWQKRRYHELLFIIDTCQAVSMYKPFYSPNIMAIASSQVGEDSLSHHVDPAIGVYIIDRYTYHLLEFLEKIKPGSKKTMAQLFQVCPREQCISTPGFSTHLFHRSPSDVLISDFFGSVRRVDTSDHIFALKAQNSTDVESRSRSTSTSNYGFVEEFVTHSDLATERRKFENVKHPYADTAISVLLFVVAASIVRTLL